jgi:hypothetical protein
MAFATI